MEPTAAFIYYFVEKGRRERYLYLASKPKRRRDFILAIARHCPDIRYDLSQKLKTHDAKLSYVVALLKSMGVSETCFVVASEDSGIDNREIRTSEALAAVVGKWNDAIVFFPSARVAYYETHDGAQYVLRSQAL